MQASKRFVSKKGIIPGLKKSDVDILLYFDRLDTTSRDMFSDIPVTESIARAFGPGVWFNAIFCLTHAGTAPPELNGTQMRYEQYQSQRTAAIQQVCFSNH